VGIGVALFVEPTAAGSGTLVGTEAARVVVALDGRVTVSLGTCNQGQGTLTTMAQIAADELGGDIDDGVVVEGGHARAPGGAGTGASRSAVMGGAATHLASGAVREKVVAIAAELLEAAPEDLELAGGRVRVAGTPSRGVSMGEVAQVAYVDTNKL